MTIRGWSHLTQVQAAMVNLAVPAFDDPVEWQEGRRRAIACGRWELKKTTGEDFEFDIRNWHEYLIRIPECTAVHALAISHQNTAILSDPAAMEQFKQEWPVRLQSLAAKHPDKHLQVYFQDESRFGQQGTTTNVWAKKGSRPTAIRQTEYQYLWVTETIGPHTGHAESLISPQLNTEIINLFLAQFSRTLPPDEHAVMIWDGAGFNRSHSLSVPPT